MEGLRLIFGACGGIILTSAIMGMVLRSDLINESKVEPYIGVRRTMVLDNYATRVVEPVLASANSLDTSGYDALNANFDKKIDAYGVYVDNEYIGVVRSTDMIDNYLSNVLDSYTETDGLVDKKLSHDVTYSEIQIEEDLINTDEVMDILSGHENEYTYYEVKPGDSISWIASQYECELADIYSYQWIWDGKKVENKPENFRVGLEIRVPVNNAYIRPIVKKQEYIEARVNFETTTLNDDELPTGYIQVVTEGQYGINKELRLNTYDGGKLLDSELLDTIVESEPVNEVLLIGTKTSTKVSTEDGGTGVYFFPIEKGVGYFSAYMGDGRGHKGVDIAAPKGTEIYSASSGTITEIVSSGWGGGYGRHVIVANDDGNVCMYAHMSYVADGIKEGDRVIAGQLLGYVGSTGDSTGNHLHFEVRNGKSFLNPINYIKED